MNRDNMIPMLPPDTTGPTITALARRDRDYVRKMMNVKSEWADTRGGDVKVAVLDTGVPDHKDLTCHKEFSVYPDYKRDTRGHGTHVGGIIAARNTEGNGMLGVAPDAEMNYATVLDRYGSGSVSAIERGLRVAVDEWGVDVINMSLGFAGRRMTSLEKLCDYAADQGVAVFAAAGNASTRVGQPACYDSVIAVGAIDWRQRLADFSNYGPEIDFVAGGVEVFSTHLNNDYTSMSGTSMACPSLVGAAALILSKHKARGQKLSPGELKDHIKRICVDLGAGGKDAKYGHGMPVFNRPSAATAPQPVWSKAAALLKFWRIW